MPSVNPYLYANDDPVNEFDPSGRDATSQANCVFAIIGTTLAGVIGIGSTIGGAFGVVGATGFVAASASTALVVGVLSIIAALVGIELTLITCGVTVEQQGAVLLNVAQLVIHTLH